MESKAPDPLTTVFIAWSGDTSLRIAEVFFDWLPKVIQTVRPFFSKDIEKGALWANELADALAGARVGIVCLTPDNLNAQWLFFEAGAIFKATDKNRVIPFAFRLSASGIPKPLSQFQYALYEQDTDKNKSGVRKMLETINNEIYAPLPDKRLDDVFETFWPQLKTALDAIPEAQERQATLTPEPETASIRPILEELLELGRNQQRLLSDLASPPATDWRALLASLPATDRAAREYVSRALVASGADRTRTARSVSPDSFSETKQIIVDPSLSGSSLPGLLKRWSEGSDEDKYLINGVIKEYLQNESRRPGTIINRLIVSENPDNTFTIIYDES